jgi:hypothetical protein
VAGQSGYCGRDRGRSLIHGDEIRPCWEARVGLVATVAVETDPGVAGPTSVESLGTSSDFERPFVEFDRLAAPDVSGRLWADAD